MHFSILNTAGQPIGMYVVNSSSEEEAKRKAKKVGGFSSLRETSFLFPIPSEYQNQVIDDVSLSSFAEPETVEMGE